MYRTPSLANYVLGAAVVLSFLAHSQPANAAILFSDNFESDTSRTGNASDADPVIGAGDVGGSWFLANETFPLSVQVNNDLTPGDYVGTGTNSNLRFYHAGNLSGSQRGVAYGTGWDASATLNQVVQFDFLFYRSSNVDYPSVDFRVLLGNVSPSTDQGAGANAFASGAVVNGITLNSSNTAVDTWVPIQIRVNLDSTSTQLGIAPASYTWSINGVSQGEVGINNPGTQIASFAFFQANAPEGMNWVDDAVFQTVPEPCAGIIAGLGLIGMTFIAVRRGRK